MDACDAFLNRLAEPNSELAREWDLDHDRHIFQQLQSAVQPGLSATWEAFRRFALDGLPAAQVARGTGPDRQRRDPGQVTHPQAVTRRSGATFSN